MVARLQLGLTVCFFGLPLRERKKMKGMPAGRHSDISLREGVPLEPSADRSVADFKTSELLALEGGCGDLAHGLSAEILGGIVARVLTVTYVATAVVPALPA